MLHKAMDEAVVQLDELIKVSASVYSDKSTVASSTIGSHVRHVLDHFNAYKVGVAAGSINYNRRSRNSDIERIPKSALKELAVFRDWLLLASNQSVSLWVETEVSTQQQYSVRLHSNSHRELVYLINHAYHHIANAMTIARALEVSVPRHLGVAPATVSHLRREERLCAQ
ncbi:MAG: hypothetical protein CL693_04535 [Cellvibrionaceae bacterium]|nr:hypothetical protein [Cellvibrionaceae bacterium]|tara:strand:- start:3209 stop:3718 length:510 start_codon:yes stop_codon:yes gene_type:complete